MKNEEERLLSGLWFQKIKKIGGRTDEVDIYAGYYKDKVKEMI